jgi:hypothetical protein
LVGPADIGQGLAGISPRNGLLSLEWAQLRLASEPDASRQGAFAALIGTRPDQLALELR